jgi:phosphoenolpyruvate synthase/pyruvate phosphate dikinase
MARVQKTVLTLPIESIVMFDGNPVTEANRSALSVTTEKLMEEKRMVNGTLRRYVVAEKRRWKLSWQDLFSKTEWVVDGAWSGEDMYQFYLDNPGEFTLTVTFGDGTSEQVLVMFEDFSYDVTRRTVDFDFWDVDLSLVEV